MLYFYFFNSLFLALLNLTASVFLLNRGLKLKYVGGVEGVLSLHHLTEGLFIQLRATYLWSVDHFQPTCQEFKNPAFLLTFGMVWLFLIFFFTLWIKTVQIQHTHTQTWEYINLYWHRRVKIGQSAYILWKSNKIPYSCSFPDHLHYHLTGETHIENTDTVTKVHKTFFFFCNWIKN